MIILAIETSCDDTCISILNIKKQKAKILSNIVSSQIEIHKKYGGVYPAMAKREHQKNLLPVLKKALKKAEIKNFIKPKIDLIAVTTGPGLEPCLWTGVNFAKALARLWNLKIIPVNHIESHILINFQFSILNSQKYLPAICLVVSGGHTQLILMKNIGKYKILGETRDDAAGECFDKTARILGLGYPGGPAIAALAAMEIRNPKSKITLPRPMIYSNDYDFSFSGLKTAVLYAVKKEKPALKERCSPNKIGQQKTKQYIQAMCKEIQQAVIDVLIKKTIKAAKDYKVKTIILGGGVTANEKLKKQFKEKIKKEIPNSLFLIPDSKFCTDNAAMIGITAYFHKNKAKNWKNIKVNANLRIN